MIVDMFQPTYFEELKHLSYITRVRANLLIKTQTRRIQMTRFLKSKNSSYISLPDNTHTGLDGELTNIDVLKS
jgi:hypothetical protein